MAQQGKTILDEMNLVDNFLFEEVMEDRKIYETVVGILLEKEIDFLSKTETEKEFRVSPELRKVRLDSVAADTEHTVYTAEMQKRDTKNLKKRSRFYQANVDVSLLKPGTLDFNILNDLCEIMIMPFDIFGRGLYRYTFVGVCLECPELRIGDGAKRIFINTKGENPEDFSQEFLDFMEYITDSTDECAGKSSSKKIQQIHSQVKKIKKSEKMGVKAMQRWEEIALEREDARQEGREEGREEGRQEGRQEGKQEGRTESILELLSESGNVPEEITSAVRKEKDKETLYRWLKLAARSGSIEEFERGMYAGTAG